MKDKISIIVAAYNTSKYINRCIDALINQTINNFEILIIEDKSTDDTKKKIEKYKNNKNIKVFYNDKNMGLAYSRNVGLDNATGNYIGFVDSDDFIAKDYYELLLKQIKKDAADIAVCDMKLIYEDTGKEVISSCSDNKKNNISFINSGLAASACNKLFKKSIINKYRFEVGKINEDVAVVIASMADATKITYVNNCYYNYYQRNSSIQNSKFNEKRFDIFDGVELLSKRIRNNKNYDEIIAIVVYQQLYLFFLYVLPREKNVFKRAKYLKKFYKLSKKYNILNNVYCVDDLNKRGRRARFYFKLLLELNSKELNFITSLIMSIYSLLRSIKHSKFVTKKLSVIKENITIDTLTKSAKRNIKKKGDIKVSAVIPNYNYAKFLYQRVYSILSQNYPIYELIILDDCSNDNSKDVIEEIKNSLNSLIKVKVVYNSVNSGTAFKQWKKGFNNTTGDYVWICETDDYCDSNLLVNLVKPIMNNKDIVISYADTAFIDEFGIKRLKTIRNEIDIQKTGHWNKNYINDGITEIKEYLYLNNTIANVSSSLIKKDNYDEYFEMVKDYKQCGDWLFYAKVISNGKVAYTNKTLNYYREHGNNISSTTKKTLHIKEILSIYAYFTKTYNLDKEHKNKMKDRIDFLKRIWVIN